LTFTGLQQEIRQLIVAEQALQAGRFIDADVDAYVGKLFARALFVISAQGGACNGFVAYYCNDETTLAAYITLVLIAPAARKTGLARSLVSCALDTARRRGYTHCLLEVRKDNAAALHLYEKLGFVAAEDHGAKLLLRASL